jgi:hypothetical protein
LKNLDSRQAKNVVFSSLQQSREASLGLFVLSTNAAPDGVPGFARYGDDVIVVWNPEDPATDVRLDR